MTDMTPERIYLVPDDDGFSWCEDPAPGIGMEAADAVEYVRADTLALKNAAADMTPEQALIKDLRDSLKNATAEPVCCGNGVQGGFDSPAECCGNPDADWPEHVVELLKRADEALSRPAVPVLPEGWMPFPKEAWEFLRGIGELAGKSFGDDVRDDKTGRKKPYWWRSHIEQMLKSAPTAEESLTTEQPELWCMHVIGPDDVHAAPSKAHAEKAVAWFNERFGPLSERSGVKMEAVAAPWPHDTESHAASVGTFIADWLVPQASAPAAPKAVHELIVGVRSINRANHHRVRIPGDPEPCYYQRGEWVTYILELAAKAEQAIKATPAPAVPANWKVHAKVNLPADEDGQRIVGYRVTLPDDMPLAVALDCLPSLTASPTPAPAVPSARWWYRDSTDEWVLELSAAGDDMSVTHRWAGKTKDEALSAMDAPAVPEKWRKMAEGAIAFVDGGCVKTSPFTAEAHIKGLAQLLLAAPTAEESSGDHFRDATKMMVPADFVEKVRSANRALHPRARDILLAEAIDMLDESAEGDSQ